MKFASPGVKLQGNQFLYDSGFELLDWDGDGLLDVFLPNSSMMAFAVHLNEGAKGAPKFGHSVGYPVNLTETEPQTTEHNQTFATCDLNSDGLFDMIFFDGQLRLAYNTGSKHGPNHWYYPNIPQFFPGSEKMIQENASFSTGPESMYWNKGIFARQVLTLTVADWDGDGLDDLLISRFKGEAPGVKPTGGAEQWTPSGRALASKPTNPLPSPDEPTYHGKLTEAPPRELYFYKNMGSKTEPRFDEGAEILTPDGQSIAAPNPLVADIDAAGILDLLSTEAEFSSNAYRVDWPTRPHVAWFRRARQADLTRLEEAKPLVDAAGAAIPAGVMVRLADMRGVGVRDLFVMDSGLKGTIRWYPNAASRRRKSLASGRTKSYSVPYLVDWDGDGLTDLVLGMMNGQGSWGGDKEYRLYRNRGTTADPQFSAYQNFLGEDGKPLKLPAYYYAGLQAGVSARDLNGDGKLDLVVEGYQNSELLYYQNISTESAGMRFKKIKEVGDPQPLVYPSRYRFFAVEDVDGDGVVDLVNSINTEAGACGPSFFRGTRASAPARVTDLAVTQTGAEGIALQWTSPAGAVRYEIRWSATEEPTELNWPLLLGVQGEYTSDETRQTALLSGVSEGQTIWIAVKSLNAAQEVSPISDAVRAAAHPLRLIVLRNGPAATESFPEYSGNEVTYLDAQKPAEAVPRDRSFLWVRAPIANLGLNRSKEISDQEKVALVRFKNLPKVGTLERAELELSTDPLLQDSPNLLQGVAQLPVSVYAVRGGWDAATATYQQAAPRRDWQKDDLNGNGVFLSKAKPQFTVQQRRRLVWDVTAAVRAAQEQGQAEISLLVRIDYTGKYVSGQVTSSAVPSGPRRSSVRASRWPLAIDLHPSIQTVTSFRWLMSMETENSRPSMPCSSLTTSLAPRRRCQKAARESRWQ